MSYRNPKQFVDTETAKYYSKLQETFTGITQNSINSLKARLAKQTKDLEETAKLNKEDKKKQEEYRNKQGQALNGATGARLDIFNNPIIQERFINDTDTIASEDSAVELTREQRIRRDNFNGLPQGITNDLTIFETLGGGYQEKEDKGNAMGGISPYNDSEQLAAVRSMYGKGASGNNSFDYDLNQPGGSQRIYTHTNSFSGKKWSWTSGQIQEIEADPEREIIVTIPDETVNMENIANTFAFKKVNGKPVTELNDRYFETALEETRVNEKGEIITYKKPNKDLFMKDIEPESRSNVVSLTKPRRLALYNYFQDSSVGSDDDGNVIKKNLYPLDYSFSDEKEEEEFMKELISKYSKHVSEVHFEKSGDRIINIKEVEGTKGNETKDPTEGDIRRSTAVEDAPSFYSDMFDSPESFFTNKTINGRKITSAKLVTPSGYDKALEKWKNKDNKLKGELAPEPTTKVLELTYSTGKSTSKRRGQEIFEDTMKFDLNDPVRVRTLIDLLPNTSDEMKRELKKILESKSSDLPIL